MDNVLAGVSVILCCAVVLVWLLRTVLSERANPAREHDEQLKRPRVVKRLDLALWLCGAALASALTGYIALGVA